MEVFLAAFFGNLLATGLVGAVVLYRVRRDIEAAQEAARYEAEQLLGTISRTNFKVNN
jgi:hypothetical protein